MFYHCFCNICETITMAHFYKLITQNMLIIEVLLYIYNVRTYKVKIYLNKFQIYVHCTISIILKC